MLRGYKPPRPRCGNRVRNCKRHLCLSLLPSSAVSTRSCTFALVHFRCHFNHCLLFWAFFSHPCDTSDLVCPLYTSCLRRCLLIRRVAWVQSVVVCWQAELGTVTCGNVHAQMSTTLLDTDKIILEAMEFDQGKFCGSYIMLKDISSAIVMPLAAPN